MTAGSILATRRPASGTRPEWGPAHPCRECGVEVQTYSGPRAPAPTVYEVQTGLEHAPRCGGVKKWVRDALTEINRPAWEQSGYRGGHEPGPERKPLVPLKAESRRNPRRQTDEGVIVL